MRLLCVANSPVKVGTNESLSWKDSALPFIILEKRTIRFGFALLASFLRYAEVLKCRATMYVLYYDVRPQQLSVFRLDG
jgi:hypothetical protein